MFSINFILAYKYSWALAFQYKWYYSGFYDDDFLLEREEFKALTLSNILGLGDTIVPFKDYGEGGLTGLGNW